MLGGLARYNLDRMHLSAFMKACQLAYGDLAQEAVKGRECRQPQKCFEENVPVGIWKKHFTRKNVEHFKKHHPTLLKMLEYEKQ